MGQWNEAKIGEIAEVKGGKRIPKGRKLIKEPNSHPYIRIRNLGKTKYMQLNTDYEYVDEETQQMICLLYTYCTSWSYWHGIGEWFTFISIRWRG